MRIKLLPFNNQGGNGLMTCDLSNLKGYTIDRIVLSLGGTAFVKSNISLFQVKANTKIIYDDTGSSIDARMKYRGIFDAAGFFTLDFSEIRSKTIVGQQLGSLDTTFGIDQLSLEVTVTGATAPTLVGWAEVSAPQMNALGKHVPEAALIAKVLRYQHVFAAGGSALAFQVPYGSKGGSLVKRIHFQHTGKLTGVQLKKNGLVIDDTVDVLNAFNLQEFQRVPQANVYTLDFIKDGNQSNALNTANANTFEIYGNLTAADNVTVVLETLDTLANN